MVVPDHVGDLHILVIDRVVLLDQSRRRLVMKILARLPDRLMRLRQQDHRFLVSVAALLAATHAALALGKIRFRFAIAPRRENARPIRERGEGLYTQVYPRLLSHLREWLYRNISAGERDVPTILLF